MKVILFAIFAGAIYIMAAVGNELAIMADRSIAQVEEYTVKAEKAKQDLEKLESDRKHILQVTAWYDKTVERVDEAKNKVSGIFNK